jgi:hypothetical protein
MQTFFIPDKIDIDFINANGEPLHQDKILVGIRIRANYKNDIDLSPFLTDKFGHLTITAENIRERYKNFISYGLMDYSSLESAKPEIEMYYWGNKSLKIYIEYWSEILNKKNDYKQFEKWGDSLGKLQKEFALIEQKEREDLQIFKDCFNRTINQTKDISIIKDLWDKPSVQRLYNAIIQFENNGCS